MAKYEFKQRKKTKYIRVILDNKQGLDFRGVQKEAIQRGALTFEHHFYLDNRGFITANPDRELLVVADPVLNKSQTSIYILVDAGEHGGKGFHCLNDEQRIGLTNVLNHITGIFADAEVIYDDVRQPE